LPAGEFHPEDAILIRGVDAEPNLVPRHSQDGYGNLVADGDLLAGLPNQNQHGILP
jgi:hypothetical protein